MFVQSQFCSDNAVMMMSGAFLFNSNKNFEAVRPLLLLLYRLLPFHYCFFVGTEDRSFIHHSGAS